MYILLIVLGSACQFLQISLLYMQVPFPERAGPRAEQGQVPPSQLPRGLPAARRLQGLLRTAQGM